MRPLVFAVLVLLSRAAAAEIDYTAPGPYPVGFTRITLTKTSVTTGAPRVLDTQIWYPAKEGTGTPDGAFLDDADVAKGRFPVVVFSHGSCGIPNQSVFLMQALASRGFIMAAPPHPGNTFGDDNCQDPAAEADAYANRPADVIFVAEQFLAFGHTTGSRFRRHVNPKRLAVSGHSFGGQTTLRVLAKDRRFKAGLALAPSLVPDQIVIHQPLMVMTGEVDSLTPFQTEAVPSFELGTGPRYLVEILRAGHCAFIPLCAEVFCGAGCGPEFVQPADANALVLRLGVPFMLRWLKGDGRAAKALRPASAPDGVVVRVGPHRKASQY